MSRLVATFFYTGHLRPAPGTWGSLAALPAAWLVLMAVGPWGFILATIAIFALGYWATVEEIRGNEDQDPSEIVIDEVAGQWVALWPVALGAAASGSPYLALWPGWVAAFVLFRLFDVWKPGPVGLADRQEGAAGVMLDDVIAGGLAGMCVLVLAVIWHGVTG